MNISNISALVSKYYNEHLDSLPFEKKFHFHSRLWLWSGNEQSEIWLQQHKTEYIESFPKAIPESSFPSQKYDGVRIPALKKFPNITTYAKMLAICLHAKNIYGETLAIPLEHAAHMEKYNDELLQNPRDVAILSTIGVNFLYMYEALIKQNAINSVTLPKYLLRIAIETYDIMNHNEIQLQLYLITHSVIGGTQFYKKPIQHQDVYQQMILHAEETLKKNYNRIPLDIKFEFLVCCALCKHDSYIKEKIYEEANTSFSPRGNFLIDNPGTKHENFKKSTLAASEHRNILFIISTMPYNPPQHVLTSSSP